MARFGQLRNKYDQSKSAMDELTSCVAEKDAQIRDLEDRLSRAEQAQASADYSRNVAQSKFRDSLREAVGRIRRLEQQLQEEKERVEECYLEIHFANRRVEERYQKQRDANRKLQREHYQLQCENDVLRNEAESLRRQYQTAKRDVGNLEDSVALLSSQVAGSPRYQLAETPVGRK